MNLEAIKSAASSNLARQAFRARKHSPKILFVAGTVGVIGTVVLACKATLKVGTVLDMHDVKVKNAEEKYTYPQGDVDVEGLAKAVSKLKVKTAVDLARLYLPAVGLGAVAIGALTGSHIILSKRNGAALTALAGVDQAYRQYRQRVADEYGTDVDKKFLVGAETISIEEKTAEGGVKVTEATELPKARIGNSDYAQVFDERSRFFSKEPGRNAEIVGMKQSHANDKLKARGHMFLNEVYDMLGLPRTVAGQFVGWIYRSDDDVQKRRAKGLPVGDNYVSFGVFDGEDEWVEAFIDGDEKYAVLDFNVDGEIYKEL